MFRRLAALILFLSLIISCMPIYAFADDNDNFSIKQVSNLNETKKLDDSTSLTEMSVDTFNGNQVFYNTSQNEENTDDNSINSENAKNEIEQEIPNSCMPQIVEEPSDVACYIGNEANLTVVARSELNATLYYQWYRIDGEDGCLIYNATSDTFCVDTTIASDYMYYCIVSCVIGEHTYSSQTKNIHVVVNDFKDDELTVTLSDENVTLGELSQLTFRNGMQATATEFQMEPEFDPEKSSYTVVVPDTVNGLNGFAVWATLADTASGKIVAKYTPIGLTSEIKVTLTSGKETGQPLGRLFNANEIVGNTLQITVDDNLAYEIKIVRKATLKGLTIEGQEAEAIELTPAFNGNVFEYNASISKNAVLKVSPTAVSGNATITVNGKAVEDGMVEIAPTWDSSQNATLEIEVGGDSAESSKYTVAFSTEEPKVQKIEIVTIPQRTEYREGESFDPTGMSVKAFFEDGTSKLVDNNDLSFLPDGPLDIACTEITISYENAKVGLEISVIHALSGDGTVDDPYLITSISDFETIRSEVKSGNSFKGCYFKIVQDISFPKEWVPIGCLKDGSTSTGNGTNILPFSGILNGNGKTLFFASGCKPLFNYVREASVSNLYISAPFMDGYALVDKYTVDYGEDGDYATGTGGSYEAGCPDTISIENVTILSGSIIKAGGYIGGFASGGNTVNMTNCVVQKDVKIGCNADGTSAENAQVGSFGGMVNGTFRNCVSYADVYGSSRVGGIVGYKGQSMGLFSVEGCKFYGTIIASGDYVGGIVGAGYSASSAPNTMCVVIEQCESSATISGYDYVGGILGAEKAIQCWDNGVGRICNNSFSGEIKCQGDNAGGVIGFMASLNRHTIVQNNYYATDCGAENGIGKVQYIDTNCATHETSSGAVYFDTSEEIPSIKGVEKPNHNRTDDPLGADKEKLCYSEKRVEAYVKSMSVSGTYKTEYLTGEKFDTSGIIVTATWSNGDVTNPAISEVTFTGFDSSEPGNVTITASYKDISTTFVLHIKAKTQKIMVSVTVMGDSHHSDPTSNGGPHGLARGGLTTWASVSSLEADATETVWDVIQRVAKSNNLSIQTSFSEKYNSYYIEAINGLGEFDNGNESGWMYTVNGTHPNVGISARYVKDQDVIILHYTDDYTYEQGGVNYGKPVGQAAAEAVDNLIAAIGTVSYTNESKAKIDAARKAYDALSDSEKKLVTKLSVLEAAEKKYAELKKADDQKQATAVDNLIAAIGTVTKNSGTKINAAWNAYNALAADQKALVKKLTALQSATRTWNELLSKEVIDLIDKIDDPVTESSKDAIEAARTAYDKLTADQKKLVTNYEKLTKAETELAKLTATEEDKKKAQEVIDMIDKLGDITADSEKDVEAARKAYDALTDLQKKLVENYDKLEAAEAKLKLLKALGKVTDPYIATGDYMINLGTPSVGSIGGEWMVIGLLRADRNVPNLSDYYDSVLKYVEENIDENERLHKAKSTDNSRMILALTAIGKDVTNVGNHNLLAGLNSMDYIKKQGNNGPIWALIALDSGNYPVPEGDVTRQALIDEILRVQTSNGGWAISGDEADADMTGMALTALAPYYKKDLNVLAAVDKAIECLSQMQDADGGFSTFSGDGGKVATSESTAQVIVALTALGINPDTDSRFIKNGNSAVDALVAYFVNGGGFKHIMSGERDGMATEQAYYALTAYYRFLEEKTRLYDMTDVIDMGGDPEEIVAETTEPTVPATTEPVEANDNGSFPWAIMVLVLAAGFGGGIATVTLVLPRIKKKRS